MAMSSGGGGGGLSNEINVTPMIDVLLVLLIIFMAALPSMRKAIDVQLPDPTPSVQPQNAKSDQIVLEIKPGPTFSINTEVVPKERLQGRIKEIYDPRPDKIIFIKGDSGVKYSDIIGAMDAARGAIGKNAVIGITPRDVGAAAPAAPAAGGK